MSDRIKVLVEREIRECSISGCFFAEQPGMPDINPGVATMYCSLSTRLIEPGTRTEECFEAERVCKRVLEKQEG